MRRLHRATRRPLAACAQEVIDVSLGNQRAEIRLGNLQNLLEQRTARSAQTLRNLLSPVRLELVTPDIGRPFYRA